MNDFEDEFDRRRKRKKPERDDEEWKSLKWDYARKSIIMNLSA